MHGSLCLHRGVLYVGRHEKTAHVRTFDLDGSALGPGFSFADERIGRSSAAGLAVDEDRRVWVADEAASLVRSFTVFGRECARLGAGPEEDAVPGHPRDDAGVVRRPVDVVVRGDSDHLRVLVASGGFRRHAAQVFDEEGRLIGSLRPEGRPTGTFRGLRGAAVGGRFVYLAEEGAGRVQVFRDGEFHFHFAPAVSGGAPFAPTSVAPLPDGRVVVAHGGANGGLHLFDAGGRVLRRLAEAGREEGAVFEPHDVVVEPAERDRDSRVFVIDLDGDRVQVLTLEGRVLGAIRELTA